MTKAIGAIVTVLITTAIGGYLGGKIGALAALRRGQSIPAGQKVLIILDQFEQWLHARREERNTELLQALRQCDGGRVQCVVMVRDDFWMPVTRFMREMEVRLVEGQNSVAVDLFALDHARKVLAAFGRAFGKLPEHSRELHRDQRQFLERAVGDLSQEGKVICVRLALFAEMMKGKAWSPAALKEVGGAEGVGVTFLDDTFSAATAPPEHRYYQKAARGVLKALLPESGTEIRGSMRSYTALLAASGFASRPKDFDDVIRLLDREIRLITPTDPEGKDGADNSAAPVQGGEKYYQLTHDYLVPSLRAWLTRKQKETNKGRAELLLEDRAAVWNGRPESRQLPSLLQWFQIRWWTQERNWTLSQRKMMRKTARYYAVRGSAAATVLLLLGLVAWEAFGRLKAQSLRDRLLVSTTADVPSVVRDMAPYRRWANPLLEEAYVQAGQENDRRKQLLASLALVPVDPSHVECLYKRLFDADPHEVIVIREALLPYKEDLIERLWTILDDRKADLDLRFRAACALAGYVSEDPRLENVSGDVAARLVVQNAFVLGTWAEVLQPIGKYLLPPLASFLEDENRNSLERSAIANLYKAFARGEPGAFARLESVLAERSNADESSDARAALAKRQVKVGVALVVMGQCEKVWPLLKLRPDPTLRSFLIDRLAAGGVDPKVLLTRFGQERDASIKRAILLSLGEFGLDRIPLVERQNLEPWLVQLYRDEPDPGIHGAGEWLLRQWQADGKRKEIDQELATGTVEGKRQWFVNRQGQTMIVVTQAGEFWMGQGRERHKDQINRRYAIAAKEVTVKQFDCFLNVRPAFLPSSDLPADAVSWYQAVAYCNWLSKQEGIPKDEWCYEPNEKGQFAEGMRISANCLQRKGYRLPTEAEWEYACRAGAETRFSFGEPGDLLGKYGWFAGNSSEKSHTVGMLRPNDLGLFDMHGNAAECCHDRLADRRAKVAEETKTIADPQRGLIITDKENCVLRGGSFYNDPAHVRCAARGNAAPPNHARGMGFRPVKTF